MGQDKALLIWQGQPLLRRVCQVAAVVSADVFVLTPWPERYRSLLEPRWQVLTEESQGQGPLVGFQSGLIQLAQRTPSADWILLLACDLPLLDPSTLQNWATDLEHLSPQQIAQVPRREGRWEPLCGFYHISCLGRLCPYIEQGGRSFQDWLENLSVQPLLLSQRDQTMLWNCNTPTDLLHLQSFPQNGES